ncbi:methyltransferase FkbM [Aspergillus campestris IBT 28561]|uniref:Methyltransferase FkbM n=1 Tax=Aspergillus campestris (strain IBT 28561) TaxID=1392248 RepID=A0A2I1CST3_ASPC2|nr:methyltransferase FkbM [Aspergillus campestris IBT 28561]PKY00686.1 methyltransferase FkbM [Aspergillus campestris IBT 28561]
MAPELVHLGGDFHCYASGVDEARFIYREIFQDRSYGGPDLPSEPLIVDVGANIGLFSLYMKQRHPGAQILAFEPAPETFDVLTRNLDLHGASGVAAHRCALGADRHTATLTYYPNVPGNSTLRAMDKVRDQEILREHFGVVKVEGWFRDPVEVEVPVHRLSDCLGRYVDKGDAIDLLKIDVEGSEMSVLRGIDEADWWRVRHVLVEVTGLNGCREQVQDFLHNKGFTISYAAAREIPEGLKTGMLTAVRSPSNDDSGVDIKV